MRPSVARVRGLLVSRFLRWKCLSIVCCAAFAPAAAFDLENNTNRFNSHFDETRILVAADTPETWELGLSLTGFGVAGQVVPADVISLRSEGDRIETTFVSPILSGRYLNSRRGLEQAFTVALPPGGSLPEENNQLRLELAFSTDLSAGYFSEGKVLEFRDSAGSPVLRYALLQATSAAGEKQLPARLEIADRRGRGGSAATIVIDAPDLAYYPITVELLLARPKVLEPVLDGAPVPQAFTELQDEDLSAPLIAPTNDDCAGAEIIPGGGPFPHLTVITSDITDATTTGDPPSPGCESNVSRSIWYTFTPATTAFYTISTCADEPTGTTVDDTVLAIYTSSTSVCGGTYTELFGGCDDDGCVSESLQSVIPTLSLEAGTTYFIVVWQFGTTAPAPGDTAVQLNVTQTLPPANDDCSGAIPLTLDAPIADSYAVAENDYQLQAPSCFAGFGQINTSAIGRDTVYSFTAPTTDNYSFRAQQAVTGGDLVLYTRSDCPAPPPTQTFTDCLAAANRNTNAAALLASEEIYCQPLTIGEQIFIFVDEVRPAGKGGPYTLEANRCSLESESNDSPAEAGSLECGLEGSIDPGGDADFFALGSPPAGQRVFALADGGSSNAFDFDMRITTTTDTLEFDDANNAPPFGSSSPQCAGTPLTGEAAFIRVSHFAASARSEPYRLYGVVQPEIFLATGESEPNDSLIEANSASNNYFAGELLDNNDVDLFSFEANAGDLIFVALDGDPTRDGSAFNPVLDLFGPTEEMLLSVDDFAFVSSDSSGAGSLTAMTPFSPGEGLTWRAHQTGTYYARVSSSASGDYLLSISLNCEAAQSQADLTISKSAGPDPLQTGQDLTYTVDLQNNGPDIAGAVQLNEVTPAGTTFLSLTSPPGWSCSTPAVGGTGSITCTTPSLAPGPPVQFNVVVNVDYCVGDGTLIENTATITSAAFETNPGDESATTSTTITDPGTCDDGAFCTTGDTCVGGACIGDPVPQTGAVCDDGDPTTCGETCDLGSCSGGTFVPEQTEVNDSVVMLESIGTTTLSWDDPPGGPTDQYNVYRGSFMLEVAFVYDHSCMNPAGPIATMSMTEPLTPVAGEGYYYLVTRVDQCRESSLGQNSAGMARPNDNPCP